MALSIKIKLEDEEDLIGQDTELEFPVLAQDEDNEIVLFFHEAEGPNCVAFGWGEPSDKDWADLSTRDLRSGSWRQLPSGTKVVLKVK